MNLILPIILILSSIGIFFGYVDPKYKGTPSVDSSDYSSHGTLALQNELANYEDILNSSNKIVAKRTNLTDKKNKITTEDQSRLEKLLPSNIDNIRLIIEISKITQGRNLVAKNIVVSDLKTSANAIGGDSSGYGTLSLSFTVNASYNNFISLLQDLENNLRLVDITGITFTSTDSGFYDFSVTLNTYWLK